MPDKIPWDENLWSLDLSVDATNRLIRARKKNWYHFTAKDLSTMRDDQILALPGVGEKTLAEIRQKKKPSGS